MNNRLINEYFIINISFIIIIVFIFLYSLVFSNNIHPIKSNCNDSVISACTSKGLSRAFSSILKLDFDKAVKYNKYSLYVFSFFFIQLILRIIFVVINYYNNKKTIVFFDIIISVILFIYCFLYFIISTFNLILISSSI